MKKENKLFIIYLFLIIVITTVSAATITNKNNEIIKLEKINKDLNEKIKDYDIIILLGYSNLRKERLRLLKNKNKILKALSFY